MADTLGVMSSSKGRATQPRGYPIPGYEQSAPSENTDDEHTPPPHDVGAVLAYRVKQVEKTASEIEKKLDEHGRDVGQQLHAHRLSTDERFAQFSVRFDGLSAAVLKLSGETAKSSAVTERLITAMDAQTKMQTEQQGISMRLAEAAQRRAIESEGLREKLDLERTARVQKNADDDAADAKKTRRWLVAKIAGATTSVILAIAGAITILAQKC